MRPVDDESGQDVAAALRAGAYPKFGSAQAHQFGAGFGEAVEHWFRVERKLFNRPIEPRSDFDCVPVRWICGSTRFNEIQDFLL